MARASARRKGAARTRSSGVDWNGRVFPILAEIAGLAALVLAGVCGLGLATFDPADPVFALDTVSNAAGPAGASLAWLLLESVGLGAWVLVVSLGVVGLRALVGRPLPGIGSRFWAGAALVFVALATTPPLLAALRPEPLTSLPTGELGERLAGVEALVLHATGALALNFFVFVVGLFSLLGVAPSHLLQTTGRFGAAVALGIVGGLHRLFSRVGRSLSAGLVGLREGIARLRVERERRARLRRVADRREEDERAVPELPNEEEESPGKAAPAAPRRSGRAPDIVDHQKEKQAKPEQEEFTFSDGPSGGSYSPPDLDVFQRPPDVGRSYDRESLIMNSRILEKKLADFGVAGRVVTVHPGPVITMYEFEPAPGVKVNRITNLSDDLALALRALSIRIIAPIPGKSVVGIEVPNPEREIVYIRDLLESKSFRSSSSKLSLALGKDIFGNAVDGDLASMPHLLVAGATGTGKSVFLNSLLCSILCRATPDEVKLLLIDPKLLELSIYEGIPHLIADVVTNPKRAAAALQGVVHKMEERYQAMAALGVRNIAQFNARVDRELKEGNTTFRLKPKPGEEEGREVPYQHIPYIVVVIDELADLMVVSARDVEESLQRLAQMARASGIHLVLATQRPSVDVLTGIIKANFPSRISFQVSSRTDSRTILDHNGAEHLLGQGDMLFLPPGTSKLQRLHGSYVSESEVTQLVEFLRKQGTPVFDETLLKLGEASDKQEVLGEDHDEFYDRAVEIVAETRNASISYIQRRLKVGYNRAARMIEQMEIEGVVGPQEGTKGREVFVRPIGADVDE